MTRNIISVRITVDIHGSLSPDPLGINTYNILKKDTTIPGIVTVHKIVLPVLTM